MITWSGYLFYNLKYQQLTKFVSKFRNLNQPTIKEETKEETKTRSCPLELLRLFHLWRHLLIDRRPASLLVGDLIRCGIRSTIQHLKFHQYDKRDHTQCSTSREIYQFQLSWITREKPLSSGNLTCPSISSLPIHRLE